MPVAVRDLWRHKELGSKTGYSATLPAHDVALLRLRPAGTQVSYDATVAGWAGGAVFDNEVKGHRARGYATNLHLDHASAAFAVSGGAAGGARTLRVRYATTGAQSGALNVDVAPGSTLAEPVRTHLSVAGTRGAWREATVRVSLHPGRNLLALVGTGSPETIHIDGITLG